MRCTEVAGRVFPDGKFLGRDIGDRGRYAANEEAAQMNDNEVREVLEGRWKAYGFEKLLREERDWILIWSLDMEVIDGELDQYFTNSSGDAALETIEALERLNVQGTKRILQEAVDLFGPIYPIDNNERINAIEKIQDYDVKIDKLTERLTVDTDSDARDSRPTTDVATIALAAVRNAYMRESIQPVEEIKNPGLRLIARLILVAIAIMVVFALIGLVFRKTTITGTTNVPHNNPIHPSCGRSLSLYPCHLAATG